MCYKENYCFSSRVIGMYQSNVEFTIFLIVVTVAFSGVKCATVHCVKYKAHNIDTNNFSYLSIIQAIRAKKKAKQIRQKKKREREK